MTRPASRYPTELELEILKVLWQDGPSTVRQARDALAEVRELAYTSVMTVMNIMTRKGYLKRKKNGRSFVYSPRIAEAETKHGLLGDVVERAFNGSARAELDELRDLIDKTIKDKGAEQ